MDRGGVDKDHDVMICDNGKTGQGSSNLEYYEMREKGPK